MDALRPADAQGAASAILHAGYDSDIGEESYIEEMGSVEGDKFVIGEMSYKVVVLPPAVTWRPKTFDLLKQFAANGGKVIMLGDLPDRARLRRRSRRMGRFAGHANVQSLPCAAEADSRTPSTRSRHPTSRSRALTEPRIRTPTFSTASTATRTSSSSSTPTAPPTATTPHAQRRRGQVHHAVGPRSTGKCWAVRRARPGQRPRGRVGLPPAGSLLVTAGAPVKGAARSAPPMRRSPASAITNDVRRP